jgi:hypothetical protein
VESAVPESKKVDNGIEVSNDSSGGEHRMMTRLIPKIFYSRMGDGLDFFVMGLGFKVVYQDGKLAVIERDGAKAYPG